MFEKLTQRSDGACETPSGMFAVVMRTASGTTENTRWFEYKVNVMGAINRVEWSKDTMLALLPQDTAKSLVLLGYANGITADQMAAYNASVDEANKANGQPTPIVAEPTKTFVPPSPTTTPPATDFNVAPVAQLIKPAAGAAPVATPAPVPVPAPVPLPVAATTATVAVVDESVPPAPEWTNPEPITTVVTAPKPAEEPIPVPKIVVEDTAKATPVPVVADTEPKAGKTK